MRTLLAVLILGLLSPNTGFGQDAVFSQFYASPMQLNPAFTGVSVAPRITMNYRSQHTSYPSAFQTFAASLELPVNGSPSSVGFRALTDSQLEGLYRTTQVAFVYAYDIRLGQEMHARIGLSAGLLASRLDFSGLLFGDVIDPAGGVDGVTEEQLENLSKTSADLGSGVLFYGKNLYGGFSVEHLNRPDEGLLALDNNLYAGRPQRLSVHGGIQLDVKRYSNLRRPVYVTPNLLYTKQASFRQLNFGTYFGYGNFALGGWYRHAFGNPDGFIGSISFRQDVLKIGVSYDSVVSGLRGVPGGIGPTFEVSVAFDFGDSKEVQRRRHADRYNDCMGMFR
ncbi:type IX secretion system PorP/SprF family membrane protein [Lewinella aquimaris]|uniref:Type IX secretion system PorP/SprF family membrane protein n=1 Tax=Neolewinella aquimaris TaxID=1835722 RepID=A0A840EGZ4_9BACT|nr:PorP/SprF family type IX secretion system membrane protein [Neolewinella aquimaris]MBB4080176.1 type IX secretion system PorP/SprF family membrane protein [Neolewinella aquimaris]